MSGVTNNPCTTVWFPLSHFCYAPENQPKEVDTNDALNESPMRLLPAELYQNVCQFLTPADFSRLSRVCRLFQSRKNNTLLHAPRLLSDTLFQARFAAGSHHERLSALLQQLTDAERPHQTKLALTTTIPSDNHWLLQLQETFPALVTLHVANAFKPRKKEQQEALTEMLLFCPKVQTFHFLIDKATYSRQDLMASLEAEKERSPELADFPPQIHYYAAPPPPPWPPFPLKLNLDNYFKPPKPISYISLIDRKISDYKALLKHPLHDEIHFKQFDHLKFFDELKFDLKFKNSITKEIGLNVPPVVPQESPLDQLIQTTQAVWKKLFG